MKGARASRTTIALKLGMAVSGFVFLGFVLAHMYGNLKAFAGHDAFNEYAHHLRVLGEPMLPHEGALWILRLGLILSLVVHVYCAVVLWRRAARARTTKYVMKKDTGATRASLMMRWGGVTILVFLIWHLLNFTIPGINVAGAIRMARDLGPGHTIVTILCDVGTRYQSKLFNPDFLREKGLPVPSWLEARRDLPDAFVG